MPRSACLARVSLRGFFVRAFPEGRVRLSFPPVPFLRSLLFSFSSLPPPSSSFFFPVGSAFGEGLSFASFRAHGYLFFRVNRLRAVRGACRRKVHAASDTFRFSLPYRVPAAFTVLLWEEQGRAKERCCDGDLRRGEKGRRSPCACSGACSWHNVFFCGFWGRAFRGNGAASSLSFFCASFFPPSFFAGKVPSDGGISTSLFPSFFVRIASVRRVALSHGKMRAPEELSSVFLGEVTWETFPCVPR